MLKQILPFIFISSILWSCSQHKLPNTDIDVARTFIKDVQQNNFKDAKDLLLKEQANIEYIDLLEKHYHTKPAAELEKYKDADIIVNEITPVDDTTTIINYSNSYNKAEKNKLKLIRQNGQWLVDLKYTFSGNM